MVLESAERDLVEACKRGDRDAFRTLFETYKNKVYSVALRFAGEEAAAMDIAQDTFVKLFSTIQSFRGDSGFQTWVYRMVVNSCLDQQRRTRRLIPLADELMATLRASGDILTQMLREELGNRVRAAVEKLPPDLRIVIVLRYTEGLAYDQIAEVLGCSLGTVASRLNRAHKALERRLAGLSQGASRA
ncbi:MAG TPA: sigma-70 family RNA polymerase sigma factor [Candidatus Sulfopaludibacter sp.]|jgi:RNA polymerase sigma-70 factor (ECF subfamily)|nr:sigma-70 family RNA polymerase sigma factor [Candidatus Sulfopaludibacter sp.]